MSEYLWCAAFVFTGCLIIGIFASAFAAHLVESELRDD